MSREQMEAAGYGVHHISNDGKYLIMGNGTRAFAVAAEQPEKDNPLRTAEMTLEDDYGMIDGILNNGQRQPPQRELPEKRKSVVEQLKSQPKPEHKKTAPKKSAEREI